MKGYKETSASKLVDRFDNELKVILMNDLKAMRAAKEDLINKRDKGLDQDSLTAA